MDHNVNAASRQPEPPDEPETLAEALTVIAGLRSLCAEMEGRLEFADAVCCHRCSECGKSHCVGPHHEHYRDEVSGGPRP